MASSSTTKSGAKPERPFRHLVFVATGIVLAVLAITALALYLIDVLLLVFASALLAILLRAPTDWLARHTGLGPRWSLAIVVVIVAGLLVLGGWLFGRTVSDQMTQLAERVPQIVEDLRQRLEKYTWIAERVEPRDLMRDNAKLVGQGIEALATTFGALASLAIVLVLSVFLAGEPRVYVDGFLKLLPRHVRKRADEVVSSVGDILQRWLLGQLTLMAIVGVLTGIGLSILGVPLALALALLTALLNFIPYLGPILAAIPAVLIGLSVSPVLAGYVLLLYLVIQGIEGNLLEPIIQRRAIYLPPAFILVAQLIIGILTGPIGVMLATPLVAALTVAVKMLYVEDVLGEKPAT